MADFFSLSSARVMLNRVLPKWLEWHDEVRIPSRIARQLVFALLAKLVACMTQPQSTYVACGLQLVTRQVELRAGLDATTASHCLWFKSDPVKILPFLVNLRSCFSKAHCPNELCSTAVALTAGNLHILSSLMRAGVWLQHQGRRRCCGRPGYPASVNHQGRLPVDPGTHRPPQ